MQYEAKFLRISQYMVKNFNEIVCKKKYKKTIDVFFNNSLNSNNLIYAINFFKFFNKFFY